MNLSDLLSEDFYWDRPELERYPSVTCISLAISVNIRIYESLYKYFTIAKRLK